MSGPREAVIVDVDGTLCDVSGIRHYVYGPGNRRDFNSFHKASALCPPIPDTLAWVDGHREAGRAILVVTARAERWRVLTRTWLHKHDIAHDRLLMRADHDFRPDVEVKADILTAIVSAGFAPVAAIDDNPNVLGLWRQAGIPVTVVPGWPADA